MGEMGSTPAPKHALTAITYALVLFKVRYK